MFIDLTQPSDQGAVDGNLLFAGVWYKRRRFMAQRRRIERGMRRRARRAARRAAQA